MRTTRARVAGVDRARLRHGLHRRGRGGADDPARGRHGGLGRAHRRRRHARRASARATRCASRSASTSTATTCPRTATRSRPGSAGPASPTPASSAPTRSRTSSRRRQARPVRLHRPGYPASGQPGLVDGEPAGEVTSGTLSPCLEIGIGMAYVPRRRAEPGTPIEVDVRGK